MGLFITSESQATVHGVYALQRTPPAILNPANTGIGLLVDQFPWGPTGVYKPTDVADRIATFAPYGMSHTGGGYLATIQKAFPQLWIYRVIPASGSPQAAAVTLASSAPVNLITLAAKWVGSAGNAISVTVTAADDGNANHVNIVATVTGASGTTTDTIHNYNISGVGADTVVDFTQTKLLGAITKLASGILAPGTFTMSGGADGTVASTDYIGTNGAGDKGLAATEGQDQVSHVFFGDPGNSLRAACNAGMVSHVNFVSNRMAAITGNSGQSLSAAQADVANYRSDWVRYMDPWVVIRDDVTGALTTVPGASFAGSVACQQSPSTQISWKSPECTQLMQGIVSLEADRGLGRANNTAAGICTFMYEKLGGVSIEADVTTNAPVTPSKKRATRSQMAQYIAKSFTDSTRSNVDGPNVAHNQQPLVNAVQDFLQGLKDNASLDPNHLPSIVDYNIDNLSAFNSQSAQQNGDYTVPATVMTMAGMERIYLSLNIAENVVIVKQTP